MRKFVKIEPYCTYDETEAEVQISLRDYKQYITSLFEAKKKFRQDGYLINLLKKIAKIEIASAGKI